MWTAVTLVIFVLYLLFLVYPIVTVLGRALFVDGKLSLDNFAGFFNNPYYSQTLANSFAVSGMATILALLVGSIMGYLFALFEFRGKTALQILIVIASMSPPFVGAYSWILLLGRNGAITNFMTRLPWPSWSGDIWVWRHRARFYS
jgi:iron(III) transport system permease protein